MWRLNLSIQGVSHNIDVTAGIAYTLLVPRLWTTTIEEHRHAVREAILDTAAQLVWEQGIASVRMSEIANRTGIGRATLYKYFPDVEAVLLAWHQRHVADHLQHLSELRDRPGDAWKRLKSVLEAYAMITHHRKHGGTELVALLHQREHVADAQQQLVDLVRDLLSEVTESGQLRDDVPPEELAAYCIHALAGAAMLPSDAAVRRLVKVTLAGLRPAGGAA